MATDKHYDTPLENVTDGEQHKDPADLTVDPQALDEHGNTWLTDDDWAADMNWRWRKVIEELLNGTRIYEAYAKAYEMNLEEPGQYNVAKSAGSRLLTNVNFRRLWDKVLAEQGFNNQAVDSQLLKLINNPGTEPKDKLKAINMFYNLQGRIVKKVDHTTKGDKLPSPYQELTTADLRKLAEGAGPHGDTASSQD